MACNLARSIFTTILFCAPIALAQTPIDLSETDSVLNFTSTENVCVNSYVFDTNQLMVACCSTLIPASQPYYLSGRNDLISNPLTAARPTAIRVKLSASAPGSATCNPSAPNAFVQTLTASLGATAGAAGDAIPLVAPSSADLNLCGFIQANGAGHGICAQAHSLGTPSSPASLAVSKSHTGSFTQGQTGAAYSVSVTNGTSAGPTNGPVTVTESVPPGLTLTTMSGAGWTCTGNTCSRSDVLNPGASYPPITVLVNVAANATSPQINTVGVSGGGSASATATDSTAIDQNIPGVRIDNLANNDSFITFSGISNLCVNSYVFDLGQSILACCSSLIPAGQQYYLSARQDLIFNPSISGSPSSILLKLSASTPVGSVCDPRTPGAPAAGLTTSLGSAAGATGSPFQQVPPSSSDLARCNFIYANGTGYGFCRSARLVPSDVPPAALSITKSHAAPFTQGQTAAVYTVTVSNAASASPTIGAVTVTENIPSGLTLVSMSGSGWTCNTNFCTRSDVLNPGASYPSIAVLVNVAANATSPQVNSVTVAGGGSAGASATDSTVVNPSTPEATGFEISNLSTTDSILNLSTTSNLCVNTYVLDTSQRMIECCSSAIPTSQPYFLSARNDLISNPISPATPPTIRVKLSASLQGSGGCNAAAPGAAVSGLTVTLGAAAGATGVPVQLISPTATDLANCSFIQTNGSGFGVCKQARPFSLNNFLLSLAGGQAAAGRTVELPLQLAAANASFTAFQIDLSFDPQKLTFASIRKGESLLTAGRDVSVQAQPNGDVRLISNGASQVPIGTGNLAYATFLLNSQFNVGVTPVALKNCLVNSEGVWLTAACFGGNVTGLSSTPGLSIVKTHSGNFLAGQTGAPYTVTVSNSPQAGPTSGVVTVTENVPSGLTLVSMTGTGWTCAGNTCTRSDVLNPGGSYPYIAVTVNVAPDATSPQINSVTVSGGGSPSATAIDSTVIAPIGGPSIILPPTQTLVSTQQVPFLVSLSSPAPAAGAFVTLSVSDPTVASLNSVSIPIPEGQSISTRATLTGLAPGLATVVATAAGYAASSTLVKVVGDGNGVPGQPPAQGIVLPTNLTLYVGDQIQFPISLSTAAPASGVFVTLSSSDTSVASFNSNSVLIPSGDTVTTRIRLNAIAPGVATLTAIATGFPTVTVPVHVIAR